MKNYNVKIVMTRELTVNPALLYVLRSAIDKKNVMSPEDVITEWVNKNYCVLDCDSVEIREEDVDDAQL